MERSQSFDFSFLYGHRRTVAPRIGHSYVSFFRTVQHFRKLIYTDRTRYKRFECFDRKSHTIKSHNTVRRHVQTRVVVTFVLCSFSDNTTHVGTVGMFFFRYYYLLCRACGAAATDRAVCYYFQTKNGQTPRWKSVASVTAQTVITTPHHTYTYDS